MLLHKNKFKGKTIAIILCAGEGTRIKKITEYVPKPLIKVKSLGNISILQHIIDNLISLEIEKLIIITGYLREKVISFISTLKEKYRNLEQKVLLIDSANQYKKGPLYSFLSFTQHKKIYKKHNLFIIFPGDTIFEKDLILEIFNVYSKNIDIILKYPALFYQEVYKNSLETKFDMPKSNLSKLIPILKTNKEGKYETIKDIRIIDLKSIQEGNSIKYLIPILFLNYRFIREIINTSIYVSLKEIREILNVLMKDNKIVLAFKVKSNYNFYDIDTLDDLKLINIKIGKKGGQ